MSATSKTVGSGFLGWVGHLVDAAGTFPGRYGNLLATKRRKTIAQPSHVFTNKDLKPVRAPMTSARDPESQPEPVGERIGLD